MYNNGFVHARVKSYISEGLSASVYVLSRTIEKKYTLEGVNVVWGGINALVEYVNNTSSITCVCFHFLNPMMLKALNQFRRDINIVVFVHGNEALWWWQRIFPDRFNGLIRTLKFIKYVFVNTFSIIKIRQSINHIHNLHIVFVSQWMKQQTVKNWHLDENIIRTHVIPNIVSEVEFPFVKKTAELRYNILLIRQFTSGKYALDIAMDTINYLQSYPEAKDLRFTIIGDGWLHEKYINRLNSLNNIVIEKCFLPHSEIAKRHAQNGIFLCPTRQDAQGVSMCEAMSSGLVPISSNNTAIPEFLPNDYNLAFDNAEDSAKRIIELVRNPDEFLSLSEQVSKYINKKCCSKETTIKELQLIQSLTNI